MTSVSVERDARAVDAPAIVFRDVVRTFGDVVAIDGLSIEVGRGEVVGLLGHNGAGKTTTVRLATGLLAPDRGQVLVDGLDPIGDGTAVRTRLGVLPAVAPVDDRLTGAQNLRFVAEIHGLDPTEARERIGRLLETFELNDRADERAAGYSTGMRQRLGLARVLLSDPSILLLDEPTASLDPVAARRVRAIIHELARKEDRTVVLCTHDLVEAQELCDRVIVLEHGQVIASGTPTELAAEVGTGTVEFRVGGDHVDAAASVLDEAGSTFATEGQVLRVQPGGPAIIPALVHAMATAGIDIHAVIPHEPTLEDVYLGLHGEETR